MKRMIFLGFAFIFIITTIEDIRAQPVEYYMQINSLDTTTNTFGLNCIQATYYVSDSSIFPFVAASNVFQVKFQGEEWIEIPTLQYIVADGDYIYSLDNGYVDFDYFDLYGLYYNMYSEYSAKINNGISVDLRYCASIPLDTMGNTQEICSNHLSYNLPPISNEDNAAFLYLLSKKDSFPELEDLSSYKYDPTSIWNKSVYEVLISNYPSSVLAQFAKARLAYYKCRKADKDNIPPDIKSQIQQAYDELSVSPFGLVRKLIEEVKVCLEN